ncbi:hypothetical protein Bca52824_082080 [Brassica carinata]|uniref:Replication factor A C-terminal domain-containing protein n=1 Tax=Brassica carinata TaxID=52824 RepID=A0A8X7PGC7_BRACI|nr:hypothetical protein Bca52824_082080 [Brassica carinata]
MLTIGEEINNNVVSWCVLSENAVIEDSSHHRGLTLICDTCFPVPLTDSTTSLVLRPRRSIRFHGYEQLSGLRPRRDLYGKISVLSVYVDRTSRLSNTLVNEQTLNESLVLDEVEIASSRRILVHVRTYDGPVMKLYIWDKAAIDFCEKFKSLGKPQGVILVTTVNPMHFGVLYLCHPYHLKGVFDMDVQPTIEYLAWLESNSEVANRINAEIVTKAETTTIGELLSNMKQEEAKVDWFECTCTIDDVVRDSAWYFIACGGCKIKATKGPTTLMCKKCGKTEITGAADDAGHELTGKKTFLLVESYYESDIVVVPPIAVTLEAGNGEEGSSIVNEEHADDGVKKGSDMIVSDDAKHAKCG